MADFPSIRITIPTFNAVADIDRTLDSIAAQSYQQECIFTLIVDLAPLTALLRKFWHVRGSALGSCSFRTPGGEERRQPLPGSRTLFK